MYFWWAEFVSIGHVQRVASSLVVREKKEWL